MESFAFREWQVEVRRKSFRRSVSIVLKPGQPILIQAARLTPLRTIAAFLESREPWIRRHLEKFAAQERELPQRRIRENAVYPFMGEDHVLRVVPTPLKSLFVSRGTKELLLHLPLEVYAARTEDLSFAREALREFYKLSGEKYLPARTEQWSERTGLRPSKVVLREARTRWGSCTSQGKVSLNWRLMVYGPDIIDSVIVHELCHLKQMNHSRKFWSLLETFIPNTRELNRAIRERHRLSDFLER